MPSGRQPVFSPDQDIEIARAYLAGETTYQIAERYGTSTVPVAGSLDRQGVARRPSGRARTWFGTAEQKATVLDAYAAGDTVAVIARRLGCREQSVSDALHEAGVQIRTGSGAKRRLFDGAAADALAAEYAGGATLSALAVKHGTNVATIRNTLRRLQVPIRQMGKPKFWTDERHAWLIEQYRAGRSQQDLANECGVSQRIISSRLRRLGVLAGRLSGPQHGSWKGGRTITKDGYVKVIPSSDDLQYLQPGSSGYVSEHKLVMARALGRPIAVGETVHHIDGRLDADGAKCNDLSNLQLRHGQHGKGSAFRCLDCGSANVAAVPLD